jgi:hypothetical protein
MADHFYTTDSAGELALTSGYWLEGIACHVMPNKGTNTSSFFRWLNAGGDHFYTTHPGGEEAPQAGYGMEGVACTVFSSPQQWTTPFFRWFNPVSGDHFYTTDPNGELAPGSGYNYEGIACHVYSFLQQNTLPLYRWYNHGNGDHFYTTDPTGELASGIGYTFEGIACYVPSDPNSHLKEFFRWYNSNNGDHFYTLDPGGELAPVSGYVFEGVACYVFDNPSPNTVSLFRWYNPNSGDHFYTTDPNGELAPTSGYVSEGIACNVYAGQLPDSVALFRWWNPGECRQSITIHFKSLLPINNVIRNFWIDEFSVMAQLFIEGGIYVRLGTIEDLSNNMALQPLRNLNVANCILGFPTPDIINLFANRNNANANDVVVYLVNSLINVNIPANLGGCATFPVGMPGCVIVQTGFRWITAHEVGHVLGLTHVCRQPCAPGRSDSLMFPGAAWTNLPPDISNSELQIMLNSVLTINC